MNEAMRHQEILVNGHSIVFGEELVKSMKGTADAQGFTLELVPRAVVQILEKMPSSDFDFLPKEGKPGATTPQDTVAKARRMALGLLA